MAESSDKPKKIIRQIRDNLESLLTAIALALILRYFTLEAFKIPTGSMSSTLFGRHAWKDCPNCEHRFAVNLATDDSTGQRAMHLESFSYKTVVCGDCKAPNLVYNMDGRRRCESCQKPLNMQQGKWEKGIGITGKGQLAVTCPTCRYRYRTFIDDKNDVSGDHLFVDKLYYKVVKPRRYDVIVFRFDRKKNYIKRLIGFGGETIQIRHGDIYVKGPDDGDFAITRKPPANLGAVLRLVHDSTLIEKGYQRTPAWLAVDAPTPSTRKPELVLASWHPDRGVIEFNALGGQDAPHQGAIRYNRPVVDKSPCNTFRDDIPHGFTVADRRFCFTAMPAAAGKSEHGGAAWLKVSMEDGPHLFEFVLPIRDAGEGTDAAPPKCRILHGLCKAVRADKNAKRTVLAEAPGWLPSKSPTEVVLDNIDDTLIVRLNGKTVCRAEFNSGSPAIDANGMRITANNTAIRLERLALWRDIHYRLMRNLEGVVSNTFKIPEGDYFAMGDNSPNSSDSRYWGKVPKDNMIGKAYFIFWPLWPWNLRARFIH